MPKPIRRFYAEWTTTDSLPWDGPKEGWQVFDRRSFSREGIPQAICLCLIRSDAFKIRDSLNKSEDSQNV